ncbi:ribonuclease H1 small subunit [Metschnikowia bicuspidata var. bicuspidata NRRL YB-4993]|uniref:Ribonuclease H1 small subunit n=1 Tax=Metschnikowia bicuspidata var. bicuspidata NRRL YB-4993 TaxID=869754 RepID=A0A1A0HIB5_9ASCO|nr:ribonuclease H1 small subunit [Metschnikowia bicuspidata var. bicuspidata NRRL YB-4993]OBA23909.1 ribonuclease H1 small subunit [Metschnikowia bicuspidata var. bicuspidata NRRL YB-4993]
MKTIIHNADAPLAELNLVPCKIQYTGPSNTKDYFSASKKKEKWQDKEVVIANFRGLKLIGENIQLGDKLGVVCNTSEISRENSEEGSVETLKELNPIAVFEKVIVYGHDSCPSENNKWKMLNEWEAIADAING